MSTQLIFAIISLGGRGMETYAKHIHGCPGEMLITMEMIFLLSTLPLVYNLREKI